MIIEYKTDVHPKTEDIIALYRSAGIKRPVENPDRIRRMYKNSNLVVTAWDGEALVGVARSLTDFSYCCYLSDLAVNSTYQRMGIGKKLIGLTRETIGEHSMLLLLSAPGAMGYYPKVGFETVENGFMVPRES